MFIFLLLFIYFTFATQLLAFDGEKNNQIFYNIVLDQILNTKICLLQMCVENIKYRTKIGMLAMVLLGSGEATAVVAAAVSMKANS